MLKYSQVQNAKFSCKLLFEFLQMIIERSKRFPLGCIWSLGPLVSLLGPFFAPKVAWNIPGRSRDGTLRDIRRRRALRTSEIASLFGVFIYFFFKMRPANKKIRDFLMLFENDFRLAWIFFLRNFVWSWPPFHSK